MKKRRKHLQVHELDRKLLLLLRVAAKSRKPDYYTKEKLGAKVGLSGPEVSRLFDETHPNFCKMPLECQEQLAEDFEFSVEWPEWHDVARSAHKFSPRRDSVDFFADRLLQNSRDLPEGRQNEVSLSLRKITPTTSNALYSRMFSMDFWFLDNPTVGRLDLQGIMSFGQAEISDIGVLVLSGNYLTTKAIDDAIILQSRFAFKKPIVSEGANAIINSIGIEGWRLAASDGSFIQGNILFETDSLLAINRRKLGEFSLECRLHKQQLSCIKDYGPGEPLDGNRRNHLLAAAAFKWLKQRSSKSDLSTEDEDELVLAKLDFSKQI